MVTKASIEYGKKADEITERKWCYKCAQFRPIEGGKYVRVRNQKRWKCSLPHNVTKV